MVNDKVPRTQSTGLRARASRLLARPLRAIARRMRRGGRVLRWHLVTRTAPGGAQSVHASRLIWRSGATLINTAQAPRLGKHWLEEPERDTAEVVLALCRELRIFALLIPTPGSTPNRVIGVDRADAMALLTAIAIRPRPWYVSAVSQADDSSAEHLLGNRDPAALSDLGRADFIELTRYSTVETAREPSHVDSATVALWTENEDRSLGLCLPTGQATMRPPGSRHLIKVSAGGTVVQSAPAYSSPRARFPDDLPVDVVYAWVDGDDPTWRRRRAAAAGVHDEPLEAGALEASRFRSRDELRYSLRSLSAYAPWVRHIWLVTDQQVPTWLDRTVPGLTVVDHRELFSEHELPLFNANAIETRLHTIEGLTEHYLYFNDDMLLGRDVAKQDFFASPTVSRFFISKQTLDPRTSRDDAPALIRGRLFTQELVGRHFGVTPLHLFRHTPYPQQRSLMYELEEMFRDHFARTASSTFRAGDDIFPSHWLASHAGYFLGRTVPGPMDYDYFSTDELATKPEVFERFANNRCQVYCLNDAGPAADNLSTEKLHRALDRLLPERSPFEL